MRVSLALAPEVVTLWQILLWVGAIVVIVVIALLTLLLRFVRQIDVGVFMLWQRSKELAANTATTWQIEEAAKIWEGLDEELVEGGSGRSR